MPREKSVDPSLLAYVQADIVARAEAGTPGELAAKVANIRRARQDASERDASSLRSDMAEIIAVAERATGLTHAQLLAKAAEYSASTIPRPAEDRAATRALLRSRGIPELHVRNIFDQTPVECPALAKVRAFVEADQQVFLVLSGAKGTRKSGSAAWALAKHPGRFLSASNLAAYARTDSEDSRERYLSIRKAQLLVLDDLGVGYADDKGWSMSVLNSLIDERYGEMAKTIITTNLDSRSFKTLYGERIADRIRELGEWCPILGESQRQHWSEREAGQ